MRSYHVIDARANLVDAEIVYRSRQLLILTTDLQSMIFSLISAYAMWWDNGVHVSNFTTFHIQFIPLSPSSQIFPLGWFTVELSFL